MSSIPLHELTEKLTYQDLPDRLQTIADIYGDKAAFSLGFGREGMIIADHIFKMNLPIRVFTIDTGRLFQETHELHAKAFARYKKQIEVYSPNHYDVERLVKEKGPMSFYDSAENRLECCRIRKVRPLERALSEAEVWITAVRKGQSSFRQNFNLVEWHDKYEVVKINPLIEWEKEAVDDYITANRVPYNSLHDKGFPSIGCAPCTRAVQQGEDDRAGRWWWETSHKECGLHLSTSKIAS